MINANLPQTELRNDASTHIDTLSTLGILRLINAADATVPQVVAAAIDDIVRAVDAIHARMAQGGGRLIYCGAGTSGRLGVVDAAEMPPTFSVPHGLVIGLIAGGERAMFKAVEGAEDDADLGSSDIAALNVGTHDAVLGIAASGRTPYVVGALNAAHARGAATISLACAQPAAIHTAAKINITLLTGPEVITGSTRMKAGTATKLALNMISTTLMIKLGKTYGNLMVDLQPSNSKLRDRARRIVQTATGISATEAQSLIASCGDVKTAIVVALLGCTPKQARQRLQQAGGRVAGAVGAASTMSTDTNG
jgi:N-acetylmuramic acid 6-phosphate etherase